MIVAIVVIVVFVILVATPIIYRPPIFGCRCNIPPDLYQSATRYYFGIGGEYLQGHYARLLFPELGNCILVSGYTNIQVHLGLRLEEHIH